MSRLLTFAVLCTPVSAAPQNAAGASLSLPPANMEAMVQLPSPEGVQPSASAMLLPLSVPGDHVVIARPEYSQRIRVIPVENEQPPQP
jgi:hypothetical protein